MTALTEAVAALDQADPLGALGAALEAWRDCRDPELAAAIEALSRTLPVGSVPVTRSASERWAALEARARVDAPGDFEMLSTVALPRSFDAATAWLRVLASRAPDPRFTSLLHRLILASPFGMHLFWSAVFELVASAGDPRSIAFLEGLGLRSLAPASSYRIAEQARLGALEILRARYPSVPALDAEQRPALEQLAARLCAQAADAQTDAGAQLLAAIRAQPDDDRPRVVYADWLQERSDPRGELLALQLQDDAAAERRAHVLIAEHGAGWLGPLASVVSGSKTKFARGFASALVVHARTEAMLEAVVGAPEWFSVEEVAFTGAQTDRPAIAAIVMHPVMRSLRVVRGIGAVPGSLIAAADPPLPLVTLGFSDVSCDDITDWAGLPHLQRIELVRPGWIRGMDDLLDLVEAPIAQRLRAVSLTMGDTTFEIELRPQGQHRLRLVLRPFDRKPRIARVTQMDESDRADLADLADELALTEVEVVVGAPIPERFDAWLEQLLGDLAALPRQITLA